MKKPNIDTVKALEGVSSEIVAGSVLFPRSAEDRAHNSANQRAIKIIRNYIDGKGIFQINYKSKLDSLETAVNLYQKHIENNHDYPDDEEQDGCDDDDNYEHDIMEKAIAVFYPEGI